MFGEMGVWIAQIELGNVKKPTKLVCTRCLQFASMYNKSSSIIMHKEFINILCLEEPIEHPDGLTHRMSTRGVSFRAAMLTCSRTTSKGDTGQQIAADGPAAWE